MIAAASWPHSQHRSDNLRASTIGVRQHTSRKCSAFRARQGRTTRLNRKSSRSGLTPLGESNHRNGRMTMGTVNARHSARHDILVEVLVERTTQTGRTRRQLILGEALNTLPLFHVEYAGCASIDMGSTIRSIRSLITTGTFSSRDSHPTRPQYVDLTDKSLIIQCLRDPELLQVERAQRARAGSHPRGRRLQPGR